MCQRTLVPDLQGCVHWVGRWEVGGCSGRGWSPPTVAMEEEGRAWGQDQD